MKRRKLIILSSYYYYKEMNINSSCHFGISIYWLADCYFVALSLEEARLHEKNSSYGKKIDNPCWLGMESSAFTAYGIWTHNRSVDS